MSEVRVAPLAEEPPPPPAHVRAMETALRLLHDAGAALAAQPPSLADLRPIARSLETSTVCVLDAYDARRDPMTALQDAMTALDEAVAPARAAAAASEMLAPIPTWIERARGWVLTAQEPLARLPVALTLPRDIVVARGIPRAFRIARATIRPRFAVADPLQPPLSLPRTAALDTSLSGPERIAAAKQRAQAQRDDAEKRRSERDRIREERRLARATEAEPRPGFLGGKLAPLPAAGFIARRARELFEEVATSGLQRRGQLGEMWRAVDALDQRMLRAIDALAVLGDGAVRELEAIVIDAPAKVPAMGFALALALGSFEGRDALAAIERATRFLEPETDAVAVAVAEGLKLAPHPELAPLLRGWLADDAPSLRALSIDVLGYRRLATLKELERSLEDSDPRVVAAALRWAALGPDASRAVARAAIDAQRGSAEPLLVEAACWANVLGGFASAAEEVEALVGGEHEACALRPLAIACDHDQASRLVALVESAPTVARVEALGHAGLGGSLDLLLSLLEDPASTPDVQQAAAFALQRITGHEVFALIDVPPERLEAELPPDPKTLPPAKESLARKVSDPRDVPGDGAPDRMSLPTTEAVLWEDYLLREERRYAPAVRFRRGQPFSPDVVLGELDRYAVVPQERRILFAELVIKTGECVPFDPHDFVMVQEHAIATWAPIAHRASSQAGTWGRPRRK